MKPFTGGKIFFCAVPLFLLASGAGAQGIKPPAAAPMPQAQKQALQNYWKSLRFQTRLSPSLHGPGDVIPPCYMAFGYGVDTGGLGHPLDYYGQPLPIGGEPQTVQVWRFNADKPLGRRPASIPRRLFPGAK